MRSTGCRGAVGGLLAGAFLGAVAGAVEARLFLEPANLSRTPGSSLLFAALSVGLYAVSLGALGSLVGFLVSLSPRRRAVDPLGRSFAVVFGLTIGLFIFVLGVWRVRMAPPDLAVFRRYCLEETLLIGLGGIVAAILFFLIVRRLVKLGYVSRLLSSSRTVRSSLAVLAVLAAALIVTACVEQGRTSAGARGGNLNVVLITIDTLRANHLEYLGYAEPTSPVTRELAKGSVVFREAVAQFPLTTPSHATILSSRYVRSHGAVNNAVPIDESVVLLQEVLKKHGYNTAAFVTSPLVGSKYGFDRGFDYFVERNRGDFTKSSLVDWIGQLRLSRIWLRSRQLQRTTAATERWLGRGPTTPFFLWIHHLTPHLPYAPPLSYELEFDKYQSRVVAETRRLRRPDLNMSETDLRHIVALYDAEIAFTEHLLSVLFDSLRRRGLAENTLVVFTADHGESLYDRGGYFGHGRKLYDEEILVPLFFHAPSLLTTPRTIEMPVETIHIAPTILDLLGLPPEPSFHGASLRTLLLPGEPRPDEAHPAHPESEKPAFAIHDGGKMVRFDGWKYIETSDGPVGEELYDLSNDPGETENLIATEPEKAGALSDILRRWDENVLIIRSGDYELDEESIRVLRTLGYVD